MKMAILFLVGMVFSPVVSAESFEALRTGAKLQLPSLGVIAESAKSAELDFLSTPVTLAFKGGPVRLTNREAVEALDAFWKVAPTVRSGGAHPELTLARAINDFISGRDQLINGFKRDRTVIDYDMDYQGNFEIRVALRVVSRSVIEGKPVLNIAIEFSSLSFTDRNGRREYHDGESSMLKIKFKAIRDGGRWAVNGSDIDSDYMEG